MRGEGKDKKQEQNPVKYYYRLCRSCKTKLHLNEFRCRKCGEPVQSIVYSQNPEDAIYNTPLNSVKKCMDCHNVRQGIICEPIGCFGTGRGSCGYCEKFEWVRFDCCRKAQKEDGVPIASLSEAFREMVQGKAPGPMAKTLAKAVAGPRYDDVVPF